MSDRQATTTATIDVVVVTHDSGATLSSCVARILGARNVGQCVLVDNASRDGAPEAVLAAQASAAALPLHLLRNAENRGFAAACNQGARAGTAPWVAFVNPDCLIENDSLAHMLALAPPKAGMLGADVRDVAGAREPAARRYAPTLARVFAQASGLARWWPHWGLYRAHDPASSSPTTEVDACSGALMLMPRALFEALDGFDEAYPLHGEDLDLCARVRAAGHPVLVVETVRVVHIKGTSSRSRPMYVAWCKHRGLSRYLHRHAARGSWWRHALITLGVWGRFTLSVPWLAWCALRAREARP